MRDLASLSFKAFVFGLFCDGSSKENDASQASRGSVPTPVHPITAYRATHLKKNSGTLKSKVSIRPYLCKLLNDDDDDGVR